MRSIKDIIEAVKGWIKKAWNKVGVDGLLHIEVSFAICTTVAAVFNLFCPKWVAVIVGALLTGLVGILKEWYDKNHPENHTAEWKDIICDAVGIAFSIVIIWML